MRERGRWAATCLVVLMMGVMGGQAAWAAAEAIKVGWIGPLSGVLAAYGQENKRGVEFAVEKIDAAGGIKGRKVDVIYVDTRFDPAFAVQTVQRLATQDRVVAIIGDVASSSTVATVPVTARLGVPQIVGLGGTTKTTELGSAYVFRPYPSVGLTYSTLAYYATDRLKLKRFATIAYNDEGALSSIEAFTAALKKTGKGEVVAAEVLPVDAKEFKGILTKVRGTNPDALVLAAAAPVSGLISKQTRELGWNVQLLGHGGYQGIVQYREVAGPAGDGMILVTTYAPGLYTHKEAQDFLRDWKAKYGADPRDLEAHGFDETNLLAWAIQHATAERKAIRDQLARVKDWPGAAGVYSFLPNGDVVKKLVVQTWKDGKLTPIEVYEKPQQ